MNARGTLPTAQQLFTVLICPGWVGGGGLPTLAGGYLPWPEEVPTLAGGTYPGQGWGPTLARVPLPRCEQTDACENSTIPHPSDAGGNEEKV